jgi:hypothetical protein
MVTIDKVCYVYNVYIYMLEDLRSLGIVVVMCDDESMES